MLKVISHMREFPFSDVMAVYTQSNREKARENWPQLSEAEGRYRAEMEFYQYLRHDFFPTGGVYCLWKAQGQWVSAVRFEHWKDGVLLEGLETRPDCRGRGYAAALMTAALEPYRDRKVYSHVRKNNFASLRVHEKLGFRMLADSATLVDGSVSREYVTLVRCQ